MPDIAWLLELSNPTRWWTGTEWTPDANAALRFPSKWDADKYRHVMGYEGRANEAVAVEHGWYPAAAPGDTA